MALDDTTQRRLERLRKRQSGVVARRQVIELGGTPNDFRRLANHQGSQVLHDGVLLDHNGEPTWLQRAWGAVLAVWPAALAGQSALRVEAGKGWKGHDDTAAIEVAVDVNRNVRSTKGIKVRRAANLDERARWNANPPRMRFEEALLDEVELVDDTMTALETLAAGVRARRTSAQRLLDTLDARARYARRELVRGLLLDLRDGTCSVLVHGYLTLVERPHGLPSSERQFHERTDQGTVYRDAEFTEFQLSLELDGRAFHAVLDRHDLDLERDLELAGDGRLALRLGWGQVFRRPCQTAGRVGRVLSRRGWTGSVIACGPGCVAPAVAAA